MRRLLIVGVCLMSGCAAMDNLLALPAISQLIEVIKGLITCG